MACESIARAQPTHGDWPRFYTERVSIYTSETELAGPLIDWYLASARDLPWRRHGTTPWGILVSEYMSQQTQIARVVPKWYEWMERWPHPADLASASPGEAVRAWGGLGYPRRALWLHRAATEITDTYRGVVPNDVSTLESLTGIGPYTARAVAAFAYGHRVAVVDTNTRRILARALHGVAAAGNPKARDLDDQLAILPTDPSQSAIMNAATMELGAVICTARNPACGTCPIAASCEWRGAGYPNNAPAARPKQAAFAGSDRQARGRIMRVMRSTSGPLEQNLLLQRAASAADASHPKAQLEQALTTLLADGLVVIEGGRIRLP